MMILSDKDIMKLYRKGAIKITPFNKKQLTPNGYDLKVILGEKPIVVSKTKPKTFDLRPNEFVKVKSLEEVHLSNGYVGFMWLRSRYSRMGVALFSAVVDSGFNGVLYMSMKNMSNELVTMNLDEGVVHLVIAKAKSKSENPYGSAGARSHFQNQK